MTRDPSKIEDSRVTAVAGIMTDIPVFIREFHARISTA